MGRNIRIAFPIAVLLAGLVVYLAWIRPLASANRARLDRLSVELESKTASLIEGDAYPTESTIAFVENQVKELTEALSSRLAPPPSSRSIGDDLDSIYREWGYLEEDPLPGILNRFAQEVFTRMGPGREPAAQAVVNGTAYSACQAGLENIEKLRCLSEEESRDTPFPDSKQGNIGSFGVSLAINAGLTEGMRFLEDWMLLSGEGILIQPLKVRFKRLESGHWAGDLRSYSGPPVRMEVRARIIYAIGKG